MAKLKNLSAGASVVQMGVFEPVIEATLIEDDGKSTFVTISVGRSLQDDQQSSIKIAKDFLCSLATSKGKCLKIEK